MTAGHSCVELAGRFAILRVLSSPLRGLPPHLATQVWFALEPHPPC